MKDVTQTSKEGEGGGGGIMKHAIDHSGLASQPYRDGAIWWGFAGQSTFYKDATSCQPPVIALKLLRHRGGGGGVYTHTHSSWHPLAPFRLQSSAVWQSHYSRQYPSTRTVSFTFSFEIYTDQCQGQVTSRYDLNSQIEQFVILSG